MEFKFVTSFSEGSRIAQWPKVKCLQQPSDDKNESKCTSRLDDKNNLCRFCCQL